jgi:hypothetical protein
VEDDIASFLRRADATGLVLVVGGVEARLPDGYHAAFVRGFCDYPVRTTTGISVRLSQAGLAARDEVKRA